jgi:hypothetical protein
MNILLHTHKETSLSETVWIVMCPQRTYTSNYKIPYICVRIFNGPFRLFFMTQEPQVGQGLFNVVASHSRSDISPSVEPFWTSDQPHAKTSTCQHITLTRDKHSWLRRYMNPQSQQASGHRTTPETARPPGLVLQTIRPRRVAPVPFQAWIILKVT